MISKLKAIAVFLVLAATTSLAQPIFPPAPPPPPLPPGPAPSIPPQLGLSLDFRLTFSDQNANPVELNATLRGVFPLVTFGDGASLNATFTVSETVFPDPGGLSLPDPKIDWGLELRFPDFGEIPLPEFRMGNLVPYLRWDRDEFSVPPIELRWDIPDAENQYLFLGYGSEQGFNVGVGMTYNLSTLDRDGLPLPDDMLRFESATLDLTITPVPEPSTATIIPLVLGVLIVHVVWRRRRRH